VTFAPAATGSCIGRDAVRTTQFDDALRNELLERQHDLLHDLFGEHGIYSVEPRKVRADVGCRWLRRRCYAASIRKISPRYEN
jgi:hypothetical protein